MRVPSDGASVARLAALVAEPTRASICLMLLDGTAWTAGELATATGVSRSTASEHLDQLVAGGLLAQERQGRHRYLRLASPSVAALLESLASQAAPGALPRSLRAVTAGEALARGRRCYDHLAGRLGVAMLNAMVVQDFLSVRRGVVVTDAGGHWLADIGIDVDELERGRRPVVRSCLDWTERRAHLGGAVGAAMYDAFNENGWIGPGTGRAVFVTESGSRALRRLLGITPADLRLSSTT